LISELAFGDTHLGAMIAKSLLYFFIFCWEAGLETGAGFMVLSWFGSVGNVLRYRTTRRGFYDGKTGLGNFTGEALTAFLCFFIRGLS